MCRLLAMTCNLKTDLKLSFKKLCEVARKHGHGDGWGIAWLDDGGFSLEKHGKAIWEDDRAWRLIKSIRSRLIIIHARKRSAVSPRAADVNSHPFLHRALGRDWVFAHNGWVNSPKPRGNLTSEGVDSEKFFLYLLEVIEEAGREEPDAIPEALKEALSPSRGVEVKSSLNFILASKSYLYAFRYYIHNPSYYSLYWLTRTSRNSKIKKQAGEVALIISSEKLSNEPWKPIENGQMLIAEVGRPKSHKLLKILP